jgi:hypothetical protein
MKKTAIIAGSFFLLFGAAVNAQTPTTDSVKQTTTTQSAQQPATSQPLATTTSPSSNDMWNNHDPEKYKLLPMPEPLTREKIFPVIGKYEVTAKTNSTTSSTTVAATDATASTTDATATASTVTIDLDAENKGIVWVDGLPQGRIKAMLRKAPGTYKIPKQKTADDKEIAEGVMIFDKDNNTLDVCIGCTYNIDDPASAFAAPVEPVVDETVKTKTTKSKKATAKKKVTPVKTWKYSGNKVVETTTTTSSSTVPPTQ